MADKGIFADPSGFPRDVDRSLLGLKLRERLGSGLAWPFCRTRSERFAAASSFQAMRIAKRNYFDIVSFAMI
jgi:hypothetical protein